METNLHGAAVSVGSGNEMIFCDRFGEQAKSLKIVSAMCHTVLWGDVVMIELKSADERAIALCEVEVYQFRTGQFNFC